MLAYGFAGGQVANFILVQELYAYKDIKENLWLLRSSAHISRTKFIPLWNKSASM